MSLLLLLLELLRLDSSLLDLCLSLVLSLGLMDPLGDSLLVVLDLLLLPLGDSLLLVLDLLLLDPLGDSLLVVLDLLLLDLLLLWDLLSLEASLEPRSSPPGSLTCSVSVSLSTLLLALSSLSEGMVEKLNSEKHLIISDNLTQPAYGKKLSIILNLNFI